MYVLFVTCFSLFVFHLIIIIIIIIIQHLYSAIMSYADTEAQVDVVGPLLLDASLLLVLTTDYSD